jgi:hypothetical protein
MLNEGTGNFRLFSENISNIISSIFLLSYFFFMVFLLNMLSDNFKKVFLSKTWKKVIRADKRALKAGIFSSKLKIFNFFLLVLCPNLFFWMFFRLNMLSDKWKRRSAFKNLEKSYQGRQTSAKSRNFFKFKEIQPFFAGALSQLIFLTQYAVWQLKKSIAIRNLENSYQDRQTSAKSRNLIFKFKDFQLFFAISLSQFIFLNVFLTQYLITKKKELPSKIWKKVIRADRRALKAWIFSSNLKIFRRFLLVLCPLLFFWKFIWLIMLSDNKKKELLWKTRKKISGPTSER